MPIDDQLDVFLGDVAGHCAENGIQDDCEVYNVAHDAADIFLTDRCEISIDQAMMDLENKLTCPYTRRRPNPRIQPQIHLGRDYGGRMRESTLKFTKIVLTLISHDHVPLDFRRGETSWLRTHCSKDTSSHEQPT